jgi:hypothetical protein
VSAPLRVGIEQFEGEEVKQHNKRLGLNPQIQMPLRALGVDYIISGSVKYRD